MVSKSTTISRVTELEQCVLAVIWRTAGATAYQVRKVFQSSLTATWRASTGAIYPILRRLAEAGLVDERPVAGSKRNARLLTITKAGEAALRSWLVDESDWIAAPVADPMRTRSQVLALLGGQKASAIIEKWRTTSTSALNHVEQRLEDYRLEGNEVETLAHRGTQLQLLARLEWLEELAAAAIKRRG